VGRPASPSAPPKGDSVLDSKSPSCSNFYRAWIADLLERCVQRLLTDLHRAGKGDYFRVLFGRVCEELSTREIADMLQIETATVENYFRAARKRLAEELEQAVRRHVERYCDEGSLDDEFRAEWSRLSAYLLGHGGIESSLRACQQELGAGSQPARGSKALADTVALLREQQRRADCPAEPESP
jgi:hypothetical protein